MSNFILITGGAGFIVQLLSQALLRLEVKVRISDNFRQQLHAMDVLPDDLVRQVFRMGDIRHNIADVSKFEQVLDFVPGIPFKQGLANFLGWASKQAPEDKAAYLRSVRELSTRGLMGKISTQ